MNSLSKLTRTLDMQMPPFHSERLLRRQRRASGIALLVNMGVALAVPTVIIGACYLSVWLHAALGLAK